MKNATVILLAIVVAVSSLTVRSAAFRGRGFLLLPPAPCATAPDVRRCEVAVPKAWSDAERQLMRATIRRLTSDVLVRGLLIGAQENGFQGLRRYANDTKDDATHGVVPAFNPGFVFYSSKVIGITDAFFATADVRDPLSGYRFGDLVLVHELVHAYDNRQGSRDEGFTSAAGWEFDGSRWRYRNRVDYSSYLGVYADTLTLYATGRYDEARSRDRAFATALKFPLPTIQALASPEETFADILAHLILDPRVSTYLDARVVSWFEDQVFPVLREKARQFSEDQLAMW
jgi:hypothetical protein